MLSRGFDRELTQAREGINHPIRGGLLPDLFERNPPDPF
jgi:hypothetical protein